MKNILPLIFLFFTVSIVYAQCNSCGTTETLNGTYSSYAFNNNTSYCVTGNTVINWGGCTIGENVDICVNNGVSFTIYPVMATSSGNSSLTINVGENATFTINPTINFDFDITLQDGSLFQPLWGNLTVNNTNLDITIDDTGHFDFNTVIINSTGDVNITNNGLLESSNFKITNSSGVDIVNSSLLNMSLFTLSTGVSTFNMTNNSNGKWVLTSHIQLNAGDTTVLNEGEITTSGEIQLNNEATLNMTNSGDVTTGGNFNWGESGLANYLNNMGTIDVGGQMSSEDCLLEFVNYSGATLTMNNHLTYGTNGPNKFENYGTFHADGLYSNDPTLHMKNEGDMTLESNYGDTSESVFSNCGTLNMENWFVLNGKIINTGTYNVPNGNIGFALTTSTIENYSTMFISNIVMGSNGIFYNEGEVNFSNAPNTAIRFAGPESTYQPSHSTSTGYGRFTWPGSQSNQSGFAVGNLNFVTSTPSTVDDSSYPGMFGQWTSVTFGPNVVFGDCSSCTVVTDYSECANADGTWPEVETIINCMPVNRHIRSFLKGS